MSNDNQDQIVKMAFFMALPAEHSASAHLKSLVVDPKINADELIKQANLQFEVNSAPVMDFSVNYSSQDGLNRQWNQRSKGKGGKGKVGGNHHFTSKEIISKPHPQPANKTDNVSKCEVCGMRNHATKDCRKLQQYMDIAKSHGVSYFPCSNRFKNIQNSTLTLVYDSVSNTNILFDSGSEVTVVSRSFDTCLQFS
jgi:hypothetical protein